MAASGSTTTNPSPSTSLTTETSLSLLYKVLRAVIRPIRPHLVKPGKPLPAGSPQLTKHPKSKNQVAIVERHDHDIWFYSFKTSFKPKHDQAQHLVMYFSGGGFQSPPASEHWSFVSKLAHELQDGYDFILISYPLAPNSPASAALPVLRDFLRWQIESYHANGSHVTLMGDSSGGNIALSLGLWWAAELERPTPTSAVDSSVTSANNVRPPLDHLKGVLKNIMVISPVVDLRSTNPAIAEADKHDPVLNIAMEEQCAAAWSGAEDHPTIKHTPKSDPSISPICESDAALERLKRCDIKVHGVIGTHDVLAPDTELFRQRLVKLDVPGEWLVWEEQMHCFVLAGVYGMSEGKKGIEWVEGVLRRNT